jgi:RNA-dependent RNA polymerase
MSQVFVRSIPFSASQQDLTDLLAAGIHAHPWGLRAGMKLNFAVRVHRNPRLPSGHKGTGSIDFPDALTAQAFLKAFASGIMLHGRLVHFGPSLHDTRDELRAKLRSEPYLTVSERQLVMQQKQEAAAGVRISTIQFGRICNDSSYSIEYERSIPGGTLSLDTEKRTISICDPRRGNSVHLAFPSIRVVYQDQHSVLISAERPGVYEHEVGVEASASDDGGMASLFANLRLNIFDHTKKAVKRVFAFDEGHAGVAPFTGQEIRVLFESPQETARFAQMEGIGRLYLHLGAQTVVHRSKLYSASHLKFIELWIGLLPMRVAFAIHKLLYNLLLDPQQILSLRSSITTISSGRSEEEMSWLLERFCEEVLQGELDGYTDDSGQQIEPEQPAVLLRNLADELFASGSTPPSLLKLGPLDSATRLFGCYHLIVTPSGYQLDGPYPEVSNRVIRKYFEWADHFLRVDIRDENLALLRLDTRVDRPAFYREFVAAVLKRPLQLCGREYSFLGYSNSSLKEHSVWFVSPFRNNKGSTVTAQTIRDGLGTFTKEQYFPARLAARMA